MIGKYPIVGIQKRKFGGSYRVPCTGGNRRSCAVFFSFPCVIPDRNALRRGNRRNTLLASRRRRNRLPSAETRRSPDLPHFSFKGSVNIRKRQISGTKSCIGRPISPVRPANPPSFERAHSLFREKKGGSGFFSYICRPSGTEREQERGRIGKMTRPDVRTGQKMGRERVHGLVG